MSCPAPLEHRRRADRAWYVVAFQWTFAFVVDHYRGLSLTRLLAIAFGATACIVALETKNVGAGVVTVMVLCIAAAFGKTVFCEFLQRWQGSSNSTERVSLTGDVAEIIKAVRARRDPEKGTESTP